MLQHQVNKGQKRFTASNTDWLENPIVDEKLFQNISFEVDHIVTELVYNATHYLQPSADPTLQCTALLKHTIILGYDLVSIPCDLKFPDPVKMCDYSVDNINTRRSQFYDNTESSLQN